MTLNKLLIVGALAVFVLPAAAFAQEAKPADAMAATNADTTGHYTIMRRSVGEMQTESATSSATTSATANTNTSMADIQKTIDANPGLADALQKEGVMVDQIGAISVQPNGEVVVYEKS